MKKIESHVDFYEQKLSDPILKENGTHPSLCHGDFTPQNIIIDPDTHKIEGLIDFEVSKYWIPGWDLTRVNAALEYPSVNRDLRDSFLEGYSSAVRININDIRIQIAYYKFFESLNYWIWGWDRPKFHNDIKADIIRVTEIPCLDI